TRRSPHTSPWSCRGSRSTSSSTATSGCNSRISLKQERDKRRHSGAVGGILFAEDFAQPALLQLELSPQCGEGNDQRQKAAPFSAHDRRACDRKQQTGIDRVPHPAVRSAAHQFVILLEGDNSTPVAAEKHPGPDREQ